MQKIRQQRLQNKTPIVVALKQDDRTLLQFRIVKCGGGERLHFLAKPTSSACSLCNAGTSLKDSHFQLGGSMVPDRSVGDNTMCCWK